MNNKISYKNSGVNIDIANQTKLEMAKSLETDDKRLLNKIGAFASLYDIKFNNIKHPILVLKTEEPGSKQLLAFQYDKLENISYDMINHLINDCIIMGATPLTVQDAIICGKLEKEKVKRIVDSISKACKEQDCILTGGETSEQPGVLDQGTYILTSSIVGIVEKDDIIDGSAIEKNDIIINLESNGLHTNGYSLIRNLIKNNPEIINDKINNEKFIDTILKPHRCYYQALKYLFNEKIISGLAHITGGGIKENLNRILPKNYDAEINLNDYKILPIYKYLKNKFNLDDSEMLRTFNMGVGIALVTKNKYKNKIIKHFNKFNINAYKIGKIIEGHKEVIIIGNINWD